VFGALPFWSRALFVLLVTASGRWLVLDRALRRPPMFRLRAAPCPRHVLISASGLTILLGAGSRAMAIATGWSGVAILFFLRASTRRLALLRLQRFRICMPWRRLVRFARGRVAVMALILRLLRVGRDRASCEDGHCNRNNGKASHFPALLLVPQQPPWRRQVNRSKRAWFRILSVLPSLIER
jgi:hypothetical protein